MTVSEAEGKCTKMSNLVVENTESKASITLIQLYGDDLRTPGCQSTERLKRM